jgi:hypothetical protein
MAEDKIEGIKLKTELFEEASKSLSKSLANIKPIIPDVSSLISKETFSQFEKIARMNELIAKQISIPASFFTQLDQIEKLNKQISNQFKIPNSLIQQMESIAEMNKKLTASFQIPSSTLTAIESLQRVNLDYIEKATSALNIIKNINTSFLSSVSPIFKIGFSWEGIFDTLSESFNFTNEEEFKKFEYNWTGFLTIPELRELYELWKKGEKEKVKDFFYKWFSDDKKIMNLIKDFNKNEIFKPRILILEKALKAHLNSDYELSIPIILSQIDGIFIEKHKALDGSITFTSKCKDCGASVKTTIPLNANNISKYLLNKENEYLPFFLEHIIDTFDNLRNDILHGKKLDYADKDLSTKLILTLLELHFSK